MASLIQPNCDDQTCAGLTQSGGLTNAIIRMAGVEVAVVGSCPGSSAGTHATAPAVRQPPVVIWGGGGGRCWRVDVKIWVVAVGAGGRRGGGDCQQII
ncbi:hypothetical protein DPEC_G00210250 [Dallia pectoralis]|uniref:Uncharacterized protein n=1 Tax=Dallia pectoralis TaxID=75939 RepID=A0ACC2G5K4_DALPE|nr:hypothetical protein DPEC_G00210250 [Dallia pectoralis]